MWLASTALPMYYNLYVTVCEFNPNMLYYTIASFLIPIPGEQHDETHCESSLSCDNRSDIYQATKWMTDDRGNDCLGQAPTPLKKKKIFPKFPNSAYVCLKGLNTSFPTLDLSFVNDARAKGVRTTQSSHKDVHIVCQHVDSSLAIP